jgi:hypothetical protein
LIHHLFVNYIYTISLWQSIKNRMGAQGIQPTQWTEQSVCPTLDLFGPGPRSWLLPELFRFGTMHLPFFVFITIYYLLFLKSNNYKFGQFSNLNIFWIWTIFNFEQFLYLNIFFKIEHLKFDLLFWTFLQLEKFSRYFFQFILEFKPFRSP